MDLRMPDLNMILLAGNLTNDPKYSETKNGTPVVNFYMASNKRFKKTSALWGSWHGTTWPSAAATI